MIGSPLIVAFGWISRDTKIDYILQNVNKFANGEEIIFQVILFVYVFDI